MDMNDRSLRKIIVGLGGTLSGIPRETGFDITAASEVMAILCLAENLTDLKKKLGNIFVGFTFDRNPIYARDLKAHGAMTALLKDTIMPNLVQTDRGESCNHSRRAFREYRSRDEQRHCDKDGTLSLRLCCHGGRICI